MKCVGFSESQNLALVLEYALAREAMIWKAPVFQNFTLKGTNISPLSYEKTVLWIGKLSSLFQFCLQTFSLAVSFLNRLLASVKAQLKHLRCIAIACLLLAAKINEEDEIIPSVKKLAEQSDCKCSPAEILRMERIILDKLHWDLYTATSMDFLNIVDSTKFIHCKELVDQQILGFQLPNAVYIFNPANQNIQTHLAEGLPYYFTEKKEMQFNTQNSLLRGEAYADDLQSDEFYDGFKYLYNEDRTSEAALNSEMGNDDVQGPEETIHACPPLQPVPHID
ncbi:cyclin-I2 isoform X2 [Erythrolamprus reginae]|uniref:cyclin-I2 isoform X2 n=1 Tax=Erythrolamprus reginae TaxID=121349 RepID=UPI00396CCDDF